MDREAMAREQRRRQVLQALEYERERESALVEQLHEFVAEAEGVHVDEAAFAQMDPEDVELVREALAAAAEDDEGLFELEASDEEDASDDDPAFEEEEITRLEQEIEFGRSRQRAYARYLEALGPD